MVPAYHTISQMHYDKVTIGTDDDRNDSETNLILFIEDNERSFKFWPRGEFKVINIL